MTTKLINKKLDAVEISLCKLYKKSYDNQLIDVDYTNRKESSRIRIINLNRQYPYDMKEMCKRHGIELRSR